MIININNERIALEVDNDRNVKLNVFPTIFKSKYYGQESTTSGGFWDPVPLSMHMVSSVATTKAQSSFIIKLAENKLNLQ